MSNRNKKIIFLDIDGVLNSRESLKYHLENKSHPALYDASWFWHIKHLNKIIKETGAEVVISSAWRGTPYLDMILYLAGLKGNIIGQTTRLPSRIRGEEIKHFLKYSQMDDCNLNENDRKTLKNIKEEILLEESRFFTGIFVESFVILDDDKDMLDLTKNFVWIDPYKGLTAEKATEAISILLRAN